MEHKMWWVLDQGRSGYHNYENLALDGVVSAKEGYLEKVTFQLRPQ